MAQDRAIGLTPLSIIVKKMISSGIPSSFKIGSITGKNLPDRSIHFANVPFIRIEKYTMFRCTSSFIGSGIVVGGGSLKVNRERSTAVSATDG
ncbi:MAG: hypothetical protein IPP94_03315 [Ignavibacteria bacterium]|nr:hypothetical protein [Ignavibacteria bacterium]